MTHSLDKPRFFFLSFSFFALEKKINICVRSTRWLLGPTQSVGRELGAEGDKRQAGQGQGAPASGHAVCPWLDLPQAVGEGECRADGQCVVGSVAYCYPRPVVSEGPKARADDWVGLRGEQGAMETRCPGLTTCKPCPLTGAAASVLSPLSCALSWGELPPALKTPRCLVGRCPGPVGSQGLSLVLKENGSSRYLTLSYLCPLALRGVYTLPDLPERCVHTPGLPELCVHTPVLICVHTPALSCQPPWTFAPCLLVDQGTACLRSHRSQLWCLRN